MSPIAKVTAVCTLLSAMFVPAAASAQSSLLADTQNRSTITLTTSRFDAASWPLPAPEPQPARGKLLPVLYVTLAGLNTLDAYTTMHSLSKGGVEANPLMKGVAGNGSTLFAVKSGASALSIYAAERLWKKNKKVHAIAALVASNAVMALAVSHNAKVASRMR